MRDQLGTSWASLSLCLGRRKRAAPYTNKLTQRRYQTSSTTSCCTGEKSPLSFLFSRSKDEWLVGGKGGHAWLRASATALSDQPTPDGWKFFNNTTGEWEADKTVSCTIPPTSLPCCLAVSLSGAAKEAHGDCEGEYKSTELMSMGRPVSIIF